jgi:C4-dicarboxylate-specific signal transduction histidine kinase
MAEPVPAMDFRTLFELSPGLYLVLDLDFRIVAASDAYLRATMTERESILGHGIFDVFPDNPGDPAATGVRNLRASLERVLQTGRSDAMAVQKYDIRRPESETFEERYWSPINSPVIGRDGKVSYIIHRVEDVTEFVHLKRTGKEREEATEVLRIRAEQMESEIYLRAQEIAEANRQLRTANNELARLYERIGELMVQADDQLLKKPDRHDFERNPITPEEMLARVGALIRDHQLLEEQFRQSQRLEAIGRLAGGVAHDFNNLLTVIAGFAELVREELPPGEASQYVDEIATAVSRAAELTKQLLAFSRKQMLQPRILDLNAIVSGMEGLLRRLIGEDNYAGDGSLKRTG